MGSKWETVRLGDSCIKIGSGATPKGGNSVYTDTGNTYFIRSQNIYNDGFNINGLVFITDEAAFKLKNVDVQENDVLLNITGDSVARVCIAPRAFLPARVNQHVAIIRPKKDVFSPRFLRYFLSSPYQQTLLLTLASAGATRNALTKGMIEDLQVPKPPVHVQLSIANVLERFDKKIESNNKINQTLEQMSQTLFKSWFVNFDPVIDNALDAGNPIPEALQSRAELRQKVRNSADFKPLPADIRALFPAEFEETESGCLPIKWMYSDLSKLIDIKHGFAFKGEYFSEKVTNDILLTPGNIRIGGGFKFDKFKYYNGEVSKDYIFEKDDIFVSMTDLSKQCDSLGYAARIPSHDGVRFLHNQRLGRVIIGKHTSSVKEFIYQVLISQDYRNTVLGSVTGTTVKHTSPSKILSHVIPHSINGKVERKFDSICSSYSLSISKNNENNRMLLQLRDTLLPKLISGELSLEDLPDLVDQTEPA